MPHQRISPCSSSLDQGTYPKLTSQGAPCSSTAVSALSTSLLTIPKQRSSSVTLTYQLVPKRAGASPSLSSVSSPGHSPPSVPRSLVEFLDTANFLSKAGVGLHKLSPPEQQQVTRPPGPTICSRYNPHCWFS
ncbi:cGMP-inhibited 3',5'-cyclic phosphodiesterase B-like [Scleropages formosus]|uniref:cGMP-inhibited 3',5'-cyclic phosphodiesterase B-like n=1 Tax=Scleropages formosus TaxID=113540 RepID=A0A0P7VEN7_SCLFO|nr:cGMP-inhibited 3',5'-cyclic phosphodiesterase B-like [Scleropages formosus]